MSEKNKYITKEELEKILKLIINDVHKIVVDAAKGVHCSKIRSINVENYMTGEIPNYLRGIRW